MAKSNGITISFQKKKNYSKNGTADFEVTSHDTIKQFLLFFIMMFYDYNKIKDCLILLFI